MYCLSQFCCFCLRRNVKLKLLHKISNCGTPLVDIIRIIIKDMDFFGMSCVLSICGECTERVEEMYAFRQTSIGNNRLLGEYVEMLRSFGGEFGDVRVQIRDIMTGSTFRAGECSEGLMLEDEIKIEEEELECSFGVDNVYSTSSGLKSLRDKNEVFQRFSEKFKNTETVSGDDDNVETERATFEASDSVGTYRNDTEPKIELHDNFSDSYESNEIQHVSYEQPQEIFGSLDVTANESLQNFDQMEKSYKCDICGKSFSNALNHKRHYMIHTGEKPHKCKTCGVSFTQLATLQRHNMVHTGEKPHKCNLCGKTFSLASNLTQHKLVHTQLKRYHCDTCGKSFARTSSLVRHNLTHTGEKPHKCDTCGKSFALIGNLRAHQSIHSGEKPHKCEQCGKCFLRFDHLRSHQFAHWRKTI